MNISGFCPFCQVMFPLNAVAASIHIYPGTEIAGSSHPPNRKSTRAQAEELIRTHSNLAAHCSLYPPYISWVYC